MLGVPDEDKMPGNGSHTNGAGKKGSSVDERTFDHGGPASKWQA
jgi:hypothetical protein